MNSKLVRRLLSAVLSLALSVGLLTTGALAAGTVNRVTEIGGDKEDGKIVVTVYNNTPKDELGTGAETTVESADPVEGVGINALRIGSVVELTSTEGTNVSTQVAFGLNNDICTELGLQTSGAIANDGNVYYFEPTLVQDALKDVTQTAIETYLGTHSAANVITSQSGVAEFTNLDYGVYLLAKSKLPSNATTDLVPFLVSVPMYVETEQGDNWKNTVYAYPKVRTGDITIEKAVTKADAGSNSNPGEDGYVNAGETIPFTITTTIPEAETGNGSANAFTSFVITDTNTNSTLNVEESSVVVKLGEGTLTQTEDYDVAYDGTNLTITLTDTETTGGLAELNKTLTQEQTLTVTYNATVATDVAFSTKLSNAATLTYQRAGMESTAVVDKDANNNDAKVDLYTYGLALTKTLSDNASITGNTISFALYTDENCTDGNKIPVRAATDSGTGYWVAAAGTESAVMYVNADSGILNLYGLEPGTYYLKETATMEGYSLLADPIVIEVTAPVTFGEEAAATVNGAAAQVTNGVVSLSVENTKLTAGFTLPQTGGAGTLLVTAVGLGLLCAAVILLVVYRKKNQKND